MVDRNPLRLSASLLLIGLVVSVVADMLHPPGANDYRAAFTAYANSQIWTAVHLAQFAGIAFIVAGLMVLFFALGLAEGAPRWLGLFGAVSAGVALALAAVAYAVDGVVLKQAVDAWVSAPAAEKATRFADAQTVRWLEWGLRSYLDFVFGLSLVLFATAVVWTAKIPRPVGYLMGASGLCLVAVGWVLGTEGFAMVGVVPSDAAQGFLLAWIVWLLVVAWRRKGSVQAAPPIGHPPSKPA